MCLSSDCSLQQHLPFKHGEEIFRASVRRLPPPEQQKILLATDAKMARLCWMVLGLAVFLYGSVTAQERLGDTIGPAGQDQDTNGLQQVPRDEPEGQVPEGQGAGGGEDTVPSTGTDTGGEMSEDTGIQIPTGKGGKVKRKGGSKRKKGGKGKRKRGGKRRKGGKGKRKRGGKRRKGGKGKRKRGGKRRKGRKGKRRGRRSAEEDSESDE